MSSILDERREQRYCSKQMNKIQYSSFLYFTHKYYLFPNMSDLLLTKSASPGILSFIYLSASTYKPSSLSHSSSLLLFRVDTEHFHALYPCLYS